MKISLGAWAFSFGPYAEHPISFHTIARRCAETGYNGIEICGFPPQVTLEDWATPRSRAELTSFLSDLGLGISGYSADLSEINPVSSDNHNQYLELFRRNIAMCADIGSPMIRVDSGAAPGSLPDSEYEQAFHGMAGLWSECAEIAGEAGVRLAWEFEPGFAFNKPGEVVRMHQEVRHPNFFVLFDTAHAYMCAVVGRDNMGPKTFWLVEWRNCSTSCRDASEPSTSSTVTALYITKRPARTGRSARAESISTTWLRSC
jgi:sugar phosphate isomerase/epimerase